MSNDNQLAQAQQAFQQGNKLTAQKLLAQLIMREPHNESAWMLMARVVAEKERKIECYERVIKLHPDNVDAKIELVRLQFPGYTFDIQRGIVGENSSRLSKRFRFLMRSSFVIMAILLMLVSTTYVIAKNNPQSPVAKLFVSSAPTPKGKYPQYAPLVDALIGFAMDSAENGMDGAPARPGYQMSVSDQAGKQARSAFENALPQPGSSFSVRLNQQQVTSWMALELKNSPDLPAHDVQVYFMNGQVQVWGIVEGQTNSTSVLAIGTVELDSNGNASLNIESMQIGRKQVPSVLLLQAENWLNQLIIEEISKQAPDLRITRVDIGSGVIAISGTR